MTDEIKEKQDMIIYDIDPKYINDQGCLQLSGELFYKWKAYDASHESAKIKLELTQQKLDFELRRPENEKIRSLLITRENTLKEVSETSVHLKSAIDDISKVIKIDIRGCSVDDVTGTVHKWNEKEHQDIPILASSESIPEAVPEEDVPVDSINDTVITQQSEETTDDRLCSDLNCDVLACNCSEHSDTPDQVPNELSPQEVENELLERIDSVVKSFKEDLLKIQKQ